ncbi:MAG: VWA-like domain-containing protein, partial [Oscillospiraceae bacterium]|nr:VWA-like domain-containing protein [Oscillospiraceae bacterium]
CIRVEKFRKDQLGFASTDGLRLYLNEEKLNKLPEEALNFILLHELFHIILRNRYPRGMPFHEKIYWNIGFDLIINWLLMSMESEFKQHGLPIIPISDAMLTSDDLSKDTSDIISNAFIQQAVNQGILSENPPHVIDIEWKSFKTTILDISSYIYDLLDSSDLEDIPNDADIRELLENCTKTAGIYGLPWRLRYLWEELSLGRAMPWNLILKQFLEGIRESEDYDFCPPDKRMYYHNLVLPSETIDDGDELNNALVVLDVSSSVNKTELLKQIWQITGILNDLEFSGNIISFGSSVYQQAPLSNRESLKQFVDKLEVGGGTDWSDVVSYIKQNMSYVRHIIVFTDGFFHSFDEGLNDVVFITQNEYPEQLSKLGRVIKIND